MLTQYAIYQEVDIEVLAS